MDHIDLILAPAGTFHYYPADEMVRSRDVHFHGLRRRSTGVMVLRETRVWGLSFQPWGFQPVVGTLMNTFLDQIVDLVDYNAELARGLKVLSGKLDAGEALVDELEELLVRALNPDTVEIGAMQQVRAFIEADPDDIRRYCDQAGISMRHMQRLFSRYVGVSPKGYQKIKQFEACSRELLYGEDENLLTSVGLDSGYYDQSHFIRCFREFTSFAPRRFRGERPAVKSDLFKEK
ncbi:MAG: AraC family transcriptional regulator [Spirochaetaceae bacterium]|nr:MAG: AraC family transcriptional regulator [Spirochaetaceae bacterium]